MSGEPSSLDRIAATVEEAALSLWRRRPFVVATVMSVAVTLAFPAGLVPGELSLPASLEARGDGAPSTLEGAARRVEALPAVEEVRDDAEAAARLSRLRAVLAAASSIVAVVALAVAGIGIGNVIRMG